MTGVHKKWLFDHFKQMYLWIYDSIWNDLTMTIKFVKTGDKNLFEASNSIEKLCPKNSFSWAYKMLLKLFFILKLFYSSEGASVGWLWVFLFPMSSSQIPVNDSVVSSSNSFVVGLQMPLKTS